MNKRFKQLVLLCMLAMFSQQHAIADHTLLDQLLKFIGIPIPDGASRGPKNLIKPGNLWLYKFEETGFSEPREITSDANYVSPLWIPGSNKVVTVKAKKLIQLDVMDMKETVLHTFYDPTFLLGFSKHDANTLLILQNSEPAFFSLDNGKITRLLHDDNAEHSADLDRNSLIENLINKWINSRVYKGTFIYIEKNTIFIDSTQKSEKINCSTSCSQPALSEDGKKLIFIGQ